MVGPGRQLPLKRPMLATAATTRSGQAPALSPVLLRAALALLMRPGAAGSDDIPPTFLKALIPMAKTELLSIFNESFLKGGSDGYRGTC